jgi:hypothetical protein
VVLLAGCEVSTQLSAVEELGSKTCSVRSSIRRRAAVVAAEVLRRVDAQYRLGVRLLARRSDDRNCQSQYTLERRPEASSHRYTQKSRHRRSLPIGNGCSDEHGSLEAAYPYYSLICPPQGSSRLEPT